MADKFYITTSIVYANTFPHIGYALESIQADVLARHSRLSGKDVFFLTGADEHGVKVERAAKKERKRPKEFVDAISERVQGLKEILNLSSDDFIRTTDQNRHWPSVKKVWLKIKENGDLYKKKYQGLYCAGCEAFVTKKDLIEGKCALHQKEPEVVEEENYFFRLSKYSKEIGKFIESDILKIVPESRKNEILILIKKGLEDVSFSRPKESLAWGIPVPGDETQTIYVWADALTNYISAIGYEKETADFKKYWPADVHIIGKDILRFHAGIWPGMLLSLKLPLPKTILVHGFITVDGQKISKSLGNVIDPYELVEKYGKDAVRYFLLREIPSTEDGDFTYGKFEGRYNADLASGLGNLVARVLTLSAKANLSTNASSYIKKEVDRVRQEQEKLLGIFKFNEALSVIWELISFCDRYIEKEKPWEKTEDKATVLNNLLFAINNIAGMLKPFLPETAEKTLKQIENKKSETLFPRISP